MVLISVFTRKLVNWIWIKYNYFMNNYYLLFRFIVVIQFKLHKIVKYNFVIYSWNKFMRIGCFIFLGTGYIFILYLYLRKWLGSHLRQITSITFLFLLPYQNPDYNQLHSYSSLCFNCFRFVREVNDLCWCGWLI